MSPSYQSAGRLLALVTSGGADQLLLESFTGYEEMSRPFEFELNLLSEDEALAPKDLVGKPVAIRLQPGEDKPRWFHGHIATLTAGARAYGRFRRYRAVMVPWLWFLSRRTNCRIFQDTTIPDIVDKIFEEHGFKDFKWSVRRDDHEVKFLVQYRESDLQFVSRLLEEAGIFYFFKHEEKRHELVLAESTVAYEKCVEDQVRFSSGTLIPEHISRWEHRYEFVSKGASVRHFNWHSPSTVKEDEGHADTMLDLPPSPTSKDVRELYDYPVQYFAAGEGLARATRRIEEEESRYDIVDADGSNRTFSPGHKFTLIEHECRSEENQSYVLLSVSHMGYDASYAQEPSALSEYKNRCRCIPESVRFRPARITPAAFAHGPTTAIVVGPKDQEIYSDEFGRVKVKFHWDRSEKSDENSSLWIRVSQSWAGKGYGAHFVPRVGQEVIVDYLEGNPNRPIVTGCVYNDEQPPPYDAKANPTLSGIKTHSSPKGGTADFNEIRFEDKKGSEVLHVQAQRDLTTDVERNCTKMVGADQSLTVGANQTIKVKKDRTEEVEEGDEAVTIKQGSRTVTLDQGDELLEVKMGNRTTKVAMGNDEHKLDMGNRAVEIGMGNDDLKITMGNQTIKLDLGKQEVEALQSIELKVMGNSIKIDPTGVTIKGLMVKIEGQVMTEVKGLMTKVNGDAMLMTQGGITMMS